ncbi:MAG: lipopolysaccharide biosynthesis protein [Sphingobacteriia bacterium]|nr:lipopolysaccharide biosynthesis protein [Sphingobacteriia bacterium]
MEEKYITTTSSDEISLTELAQKIKTFVTYLKTKWVSFFITGIIGGILGLGYYYMQSPKYTATCTFILEEKSAGAGGLAGLASQFGFDIGGGASSLFAGDNLLEIIPSKNIVEKVLLSKVDSSGQQTLADLFLEFTKLKKAWDKKERTRGVNFLKITDPQKMNLVQDSVLNVIYSAVVKSYLSVDWVRKKASLIRVSVTSKNERFSKYLTERVIEQSKKLYIDLKTGTSQANVNRLQRRADSLYALLNNKSYQVAESQVLNVNPAMKSALVATEISARDKAVLGTIYAEVVKNLETSKILLSQQMPVMQLLDKSEFPLVLSKNGRLVCLLLGLLISCLLGLVFFSFEYLIKKN